jgi:hypothetical protein
VIAAGLFIETHSNHYYYGDYYDHRYEERGFRPWYSRQDGRYGDDPIYTQYRSTQLRIDPDWDVHMDEQFRYRRDHVEARPAQTLALQLSININRTAGAPENVIIGRSFAEAALSKTSPMRFATVNTDERKQFETRGQEVRKFQLERAKIEMAPADAGHSRGVPETAQPVKMQLPVSPVAARQTEHVEGVKAPPPMPVTPKPQAVERGVRQGNPEKTETITGRPQPEDKPKDAETTPTTATQKPNRVGPKPKVTKPEPTPQTTEAGPSTANEKPQRVDAKPDVVRTESKPQDTAPQEKPAKRETGHVNTKTESHGTQDARTTRPQKVQAKPEAQPASRQVRNAPKTVEPQHESPKVETVKEESKPQQAESKAQAPKSDFKKQQGKQQKAPNTDNNDKKHEER